MSKKVASIDPGKHKYGWAYFVDDALVDCGWADVKGKLPRALNQPGIEFIFEHPKVYPHGQGVKTNPNDLFGLVFALGRVQGMYETLFGECVYTEVFPRGWKGQTPKDVQNRRDMAKLTEAELGCVPNNHNVKDAVGIGLWFLGRKRKR